MLVDDHFIVLQGIRSLLHGAEDIEIIGVAMNGREALEQVSLLRPHVVLMDLVMPEMGGVEATRRLLVQFPGTAVLILSGSGTEQEILAAVREGALGYLSKEADRQECLEAIRRVHHGEPFLPPSLTRLLLASLRGREGSGGKGLPPAAAAPTPRELEILKCIAAGLDDLEIARQLFISTGTVRTHVSNILGKLGLKNRVEATLYALRRGIATLDDSPPRPRGGPSG